MGKYFYPFKSMKYEVLGTPQMLLLYCVCGGVEHSIPMWQHWLSDNLLRHWSDVEVNNAQGGQTFRDLANEIIVEEMYNYCYFCYSKWNAYLTEMLIYWVTKFKALNWTKKWSPLLDLNLLNTTPLLLNILWPNLK